MKSKIFKYILLLIAIGLPIEGLAQITDVKTLTVNYQRNIKKTVSSGDFDYYSVSAKEIGRTQGNEIFRTFYVFDISSIASANNVTIDNVKVEYYVGSSGSYNFKITGPSSVTEGTSEANLESDWNAVNNATSMHSGITYQSGTFNSSSDIKQYLTDNLSTNKLILGVASESENTAGSDTDITLDITVTYTYTPYSVTVRNDFGGTYFGGQVKVGKNTAATNRTSPYLVENLENGDAVNVEALDNQSYNNYDWVFNNTEGSSNKSNWRITKNGATTNLSNPNNQSNSRNMNNDQNAIIFNEQKPLFEVARKDKTEYGTFAGHTYDPVVQFNTQNITAPSTKNVSGKTLDFAGWQDISSTNLNRTVIPNDHTDYVALYKGKNISTDSEAYTNNSQRRFIQTKPSSTVWLHKVYASMGYIWIEHSSNGGSTWTIGNDGRPLNTNSNGAKNPSIAFTYQDFGPDDTYYIGVVWQEKYGSNYKINGKMFTQFDSGSELPDDGTSVVTLHTEPSDSYSIDANPNLVLAPGNWAPYLVTFERKSTSGSLSPGINWLVGNVEDGSGQLAGPFGTVESEGLITGTNASTINTQSSLYTGDDSKMIINFIYQEGTGINAKIYSKYVPIHETSSNNWEIDTELFVDDGLISYTSFSWSPSLTTLGGDGGNYVACWQELYDVVLFYFGEPDTRHYYGYDVQSCSITRGGSGGYVDHVGFLVWSETSGSSWANKSIRFGASGGDLFPLPSSINTLSSTGKYIQIASTGTDNLANMYASSFKPTGSPYTFNSSGAITPVPVKATTAPAIVEGRGFIIENGDASFNYRFGNLNVDGQDIRFVEAPDSLDYGDLETLNSVLVTEPFQITSESNIIFSERPGFADSIASKNALKPGDYIHYKILLVNDDTGEPVGVIKNVNITASNTRNLKSDFFSVSPEGLAGKTVRAKIELQTNLIEQILVQENRGRAKKTSNLLLTKRYAESNEALNKSYYQELELEAPDGPSEYSLAQNYPNPFNPTTQIEYQIPNAGLVQLEVFDILGRKIQTLVNETREVGTHTVTFDASALASGVYLYRLTSGSFVASKKLFLIK